MAASVPTMFLACHDCGVLQPIAETDAHDSDDAEAAMHEGFEEFLAGHRTHRTARLHRDGSESRSDRPLWDPMATVTFSATDGDLTYVVTAARTSIDAPRVYRFVPGTLTAPNSEVAIDTADLRRGLDLEFHPHALRPTKLDRFLSAVEEIIGHIDPQALDIAFDDADDPAVSVARMPDAAYRQLVGRCTEIFDAWELSRVTHFLHDNRAEDGLLALRVRRHHPDLTG